MPNVNALPSGTGVHLLIIVAATLQLSFWLGSFLPSEIDFVSLLSVRQPGLYNTDSSVIGLGLCLIISCGYAIIFINRRKKAFGPFVTLSDRSPAYARINLLNATSLKPVKRVFVGGTIFDTDALAFGFGPWRSVLIGRGFEVMATLSPDDFDLRFSHELAHFENRDTINGLIGLSLLVAALCLFGIVIIWQLIRPLMRIYLMGDSEYWTKYNIYKTLSVLSMLIPGAMFWITTLVLEFLALLRLREVLADARASFNGYQKQMLATLSAKSHLTRCIFELIRAHPSAKKRFDWCMDPVAMYESSLLRFFSVGFFFAVSMYQAKTTLQMGLGSLGSPSCDTPFQCAMLIGSNTGFYVSSALVITLLSAALAFLSLSLLLSFLIRRRGTHRIIAAIFFCAAASSAGYAFGECFHPFDYIEQTRSASSILQGKFRFASFLYMPEVSMLNRIAIFAGSHLVSTIILGTAAAAIINGSRKKPIANLEWMGLVILSVLLSSSILNIVGAMYVSETQTPPLGYYIGMAIFFMLYMTAFLLLVWRLTGRKLSQNDLRPIWLYVKGKENNI